VGQKLFWLTSVLSVASVVHIDQNLLHAPQKSLRKLSVQNGLSHGSVHKAAENLKLYPNHVHVVHELKEPVKEKLLQYCRWCTYFIQGGIDILGKVFYCF
jgi:hypothetical protein